MSKTSVPAHPYIYGKATDINIEGNAELPISIIRFIMDLETELTRLSKSPKYATAMSYFQGISLSKQWVHVTFQPKTPILLMQKVMSVIQSKYVFADKPYKWNLFSTKRYLAIGPRSSVTRHWGGTGTSYTVKFTS